MGFMDGLGRMIQGKPVFVDGQQQQSVNEPQQASGEKIIPKVFVIRADCNVSNGHMELRVHIKNESQVEVHADNIRIFETVVQLDRNIHPNETADFTVYNGPAMQDDDKNKCELKYRTTDGDYFAMQHVVEYGFNNNTYVVHNIRPVGPINDI